MNIPSWVDIGSKGALHRQTEDVVLFSDECTTMSTLQLSKVLTGTDEQEGCQLQAGVDQAVHTVYKTYSI